MSGRNRKFSDREIIDALDKGDLIQARAAEILGTTSTLVSRYCRRLCLRFEQGPPSGQGRQGQMRPRIFSDAELRQALELAGSQSAAARLLGVSRQAVSARLKVWRSCEPDQDGPSA